jgi:hypothetical protein
MFNTINDLWCFTFVQRKSETAVCVLAPARGSKKRPVTEGEFSDGSMGLDGIARVAFAVGADSPLAADDQRTWAMTVGSLAGMFAIMLLSAHEDILIAHITVSD